MMLMLHIHSHSQVNIWKGRLSETKLFRRVGYDFLLIIECVVSCGTKLLVTDIHGV